MEPTDELVTLRTYPFPAHAEAVRLGLEARGVEAIVTDWHVPVALLWLLNHEWQWSALQVPRSQADRAALILLEIDRKRSRRHRPGKRAGSTPLKGPTMTDRDEFDDLESQLYALRLQVATLYRLVVAKGLASPDELRSLMEKVDAEDGARDDEFFGDIVEGPPPGDT